MRCSSSSPEPSNMPNMPDEEVFSMNNNDVYLHGRVDPGVDSNISLLETVDTPETSTRAQRLKDLESVGIANHQTLHGLINVAAASHPDKCFLLSTLPAELIDTIMQLLEPEDLISASHTCRALSQHARSDICWQHHVQKNIPGVKLKSPSPCKTYRELYMAHDPRWFLTKYKIWFSDYFLLGKIIICRYDPRRGCIEGYRLLAEKEVTAFDPWEADDEVLIHSFAPRPRLHMDKPVIQFDLPKTDSLRRSSRLRASAQRSSTEVPMRIDAERQPHGVFSNFIPARPWPDNDLENVDYWPPKAIPARHRVRIGEDEGFVPLGNRPVKRSEATDQAFRVRRWMEMNNNQGRSVPGVHLGEEIHTYSTLDPSLYTPTEEKPFRGIWVGDYSGHGCEFLLMNQPDDEEPFDETSVVQAEDETVDEWEARKKIERNYRGKLEAIKLTGDPNIPRGQYTFVADDIGSGGFIRNATEERFKGARVVKSRGHIAARMFRNPKYIESQLIMISHDRLAQYWVGFGHISFYQRVDIDQFLSPLNDPPPATLRDGHLVGSFLDH